MFILYLSNIRVGFSILLFLKSTVESSDVKANVISLVETNVKGKNNLETYYLEDRKPAATMQAVS